MAAAKPASPVQEPVRTEVIAASAGSIENSRWGNRLAFMHWTTAALLAILAAAVWRSSPHAITALSGLFVVNAVLMVVTPSAEQITKMLAQVAAIRFGVGAPPKDPAP